MNYRSNYEEKNQINSVELLLFVSKNRFLENLFVIFLFLFVLIILYLLEGQLELRLHVTVVMGNINTTLFSSWKKRQHRIVYDRFWLSSQIIFLLIICDKHTQIHLIGSNLIIYSNWNFPYLHKINKNIFFLMFHVCGKFVDNSLLKYLQVAACILSLSKLMFFFLFFVLFVSFNTFIWFAIPLFIATVHEKLIICICLQCDYHSKFH